MVDWEPKSSDEVRAWVAEATERHELFPVVAKASDEHQAVHGCTAYRSSNAPLLAVLVASIRAKNILEVGCGVGYSTLWIAHACAPDGKITTVEKDPLHVELALNHFTREGVFDRIEIKQGSDNEVLPTLSEGYDFVFYDADVPGEWHLEQFARLVRTGGILATSNLFLGQFDPNMASLKRGAHYRQLLLHDEKWLTAFTGDWAVSVRR
jgi:predicted O-methyltransferase YrrM